MVGSSRSGEPLAQTTGGSRRATDGLKREVCRQAQWVVRR